MKVEADALGDTSLIAEMAAMEHQLQVLPLTDDVRPAGCLRQPRVCNTWHTDLHSCQRSLDPTSVDKAGAVWKLRVTQAASAPDTL